MPGIISAVLLPVAFYFFAEKKVEELSVAVIPFNYIDTTRVHYDEYFLPRRNYINIVFSGNVHTDRIKLDFVQIAMREIITGNDTSNALHFVFTDNSRYETVIGLLDKLRIEDAKYYFLYNKDAWFFHRQPETKPLEYECLLCNDVVVVQPKISWWTKTKEKLSVVWTSSWQLVVLFLCFIITVLIVKQKNKNS